ncbi:MAG: hypothetical protein HN403_09660 [Rhodospirillales bacterium]|jgi:hypothetical protein|nr:hypothetical protein [Rhodospirillales bacterium]
MSRVFFVMVAVAVLLGKSFAAASPLRESPENPYLVQIKAQCVMPRKSNNRDILVNACKQCRAVTVQRHKRGGGFPIKREFRVPARGKVQLSFRGSGKVRVIADAPCDQPDVVDKYEIKDCAKIAKLKNGSPALLNACPVCRGVVLEKVAANGRKERGTYMVGARTALPVPLRGAARLQIVNEIPCKK